MPTEAWLEGPVEGVDPFLMPAAHSLLQSRRDIEAAAGMSPGELWITPGGAASAGFHLRHLAGSIDRLLTYAAGAQLSDRQRERLQEEAEAGKPPAEARRLVEEAQAAIDHALEAIRQVRHDELLEAREVGRARLPSNVLGLLFHIAEHTQRHAGQVITTAKIVKGLGLVPSA